MEINGRVALVTGAASGIGRATSLRLAQAGARVVLADLDDAAAKQAVQTIRESGGEATFVRADITELDQVRLLVEATEQTYGGLDILHNNAGIFTGFPRFPEATPDRWRRVVEVNILGVLMGTWAAVPAMTRRGGGVIINMASVAGLGPASFDPVYAATKAAVVNFTRSLAYLKEEHNIRVNCVCPGLVDTPLGRAVIRPPEIPSGALQRLIPPEEVANSILELIRNDEANAKALRIRYGQPPEWL